MTIEQLDVRKQENKGASFKLALDLGDEFLAQDIKLYANPKFGGIGVDCFGFSAQDVRSNRDLGFLQILFDPDGWTALATLTEDGKRLLQTLATVIGRDPEETKFQELKITAPMYRTHFLYEQTETPPAK